MTDKVYYVKFRVYLKELLEFYKDNPNYGTLSKPLPADSFCEIVAPSSVFYGPLRNIMVFQDDAIYRWTIESIDGTPISFTQGDNAEMTMEMITEQPTKQKWEKVFKNPPNPDSEGKLKIKNKTKDENIFEMTTNTNIKGGGNIKYSFRFEFEINGTTMYGLIDPTSSTETPPPDEP